MSNSPLVEYVKLSPHHSGKRKYPITKITIHHTAGKLSVEALGEDFARPLRKGSSNYGVGDDGRIAMYVEETNRPWTSSNSDNDNRAVTIEVVNSGGAPNWPVSDKALEATIELCVDICKRNNIKALNYTGDKTGNLTMHKWFANTLCPGPYLSGKFPYIAKEVNKRLGTTGIVVEDEETGKKVDTVNIELPVLKRGMKGEAVRSWQYFLVANGYDPKGTDGSFGPGCEAATKQYQKDHKFTVDGKVGPQVYGSIFPVG